MVSAALARFDRALKPARYGEPVRPLEMAADHGEQPVDVLREVLRAAQQVAVLQQIGLLPRGILAPPRLNDASLHVEQVRVGAQLIALVQSHRSRHQRRIEPLQTLDEHRCRYSHPSRQRRSAA